MSKEYIEITEKTLDEAITTACRRLSVPSNRLDYIIVQKEKTGFLGIGAKPAIIKARVKNDAAQVMLENAIEKVEKKVQKDFAAKIAKSEEKKEETASVPSAKPEKKAPVKHEKEAKAEKKETEKAEKSEKKPARGDTPRRNKQRGNKKPTDTSKNE